MRNAPGSRDVSQRLVVVGRGVVKTVVEWGQRIVGVQRGGAAQVFLAGVGGNEHVRLPIPH